MQDIIDYNFENDSLTAFKLFDFDMSEIGVWKKKGHAINQGKEYDLLYVHF